jgi:hypothetical protein
MSSARTNLNNYIITVKASLPYPITREYRVQASKLIIAMARGGKLFRREKANKKITELTIIGRYIGRGL